MNTAIEPIKIETRTGNRKPKGRRSAPKADERRIAKLGNPAYAYTFKDPNVGQMDVLNTDAGWWIGELGKVKVQKLIDSWKMDLNDDEACFYAGITVAQLKYFQRLHPELYTIKHMCKQNLGIHAKKNFAKQVESGEAALMYLRLKRKDEGYNPRVEVTGENGRDLYDGLSQEIKKLGEALRLDTTDNEFYDEDEDTTQEHAGQLNAGNANAGSVGAGNEASLAENNTQGQVIPA
jgi:hypothetical protein